MNYQLAFYIVSSYLFIAFILSFYLRHNLFKAIQKIDKLGEMKVLSLGLVTVAVLWPIWLVKLIIILIKLLIEKSRKNG